MYRLESQGNGLFYTLWKGDESLFFQGDDAIAFENRLEKLELLGWETDRVLAELWQLYN